MSIDGIKWHPHAKVLKYSAAQTEELGNFLGRQPTYADFVAHGVDPVGTAEAEGNALVTAGLTRITNLIIGGGAQALSTTRAMAGVGDGSTGVTAGDVDLSAAAGSTHRWFQAMDGSNPTVSAGVITGNTTFGTADGNFAWNEWCWAIATAAPVASAVIATATTSGIMLNRKVQSLGTKSAGSTWTLQATVTLS